MKRNLVNIELHLTEAGLKRTQTVPTYRAFFHDEQRQKLTVGVNYLTVNHTVWGLLKRFEDTTMWVKKI